MSQHLINCPSCGNIHEVDVFRNAGKPVSMAALDTPGCSLNTEDLDIIEFCLQRSIPVTRKVKIEGLDELMKE